VYRFASFALLVACSTPSQGPDDASRTTGTPTTPEPTAPGGLGGLVWVDAEGEVVEGAVTYDGRPGLVDSDGNIWALDPWSGEIGAWPTVNTGTPLYEVYVDDRCQTAGYSISGMHPPLVVMQVADGPFVVVAPDAQPEEMATFGGDACERQGDPVVVLASDTMAVIPPSPTWTAPLHPAL